LPKSVGEEQYVEVVHGEADAQRMQMNEVGERRLACNSVAAVISSLR